MNTKVYGNNHTSLPLKKLKEFDVNVFQKNSFAITGSLF